MEVGGDGKLDLILQFGRDFASLTQMKLLSLNQLLKFTFALVFAVGMVSCETVDKGKEKWDGMSKKDRNTVIGGVGGAVVGAAVSGKKATGAIVGGAAGAVGGRVYTDRKEKKDAEAAGSVPID